jgi:hypothetical protein
VRLRSDPVDLALQYSGGIDLDALVETFRARRAALQSELDAWQRREVQASPHLHPVERLSFRHQQIRLDAELRWHDLVIDELPTATAEPSRRGDHS